MDDKTFIGSSRISGEPKQKKPASADELPSEYGDTRIVALVRDPLWIHTYWEVSPRKLDDIRGMLGGEFQNSRHILRVYDVTGVDFNGENFLSCFDIQVDRESRSWYVNVGNPDREYVIDYGILTPGGQFILIARSNRIKTPRMDISPNIDEKWMMVEEHYSKIIEMSGAGQIGKASADIMSEITKRLFSESNLSSGTLSSMSSGTVQAKKAHEEDSFWFKVGAELIIYGETLPDAKVTLSGNPVTLRKDGSFTLRFELPDGDHKFPIKAVSANGKHKREVSINVKRDTE